MAFNDNLNQTPQTAARVVTLLFNDESVELAPAEYSGKSLTQLFTDFGGRLGTDVARITSYTVDNIVRDGSTPVRDGEVVRGIAKTDAKNLMDLLLFVAKTDSKN
jgi:hypothetical protein